MRLGLSYIFYENKNISTSTKTQIINFIEQADIHQMKVLCMDGELVSKGSLDENTRQIVDDRFDEALIEKINTAALKGVKELTNLKEYKSVLNEADPAKIQNKIRLMNHQMAALRSSRNDCSKLDDPNAVRRCVSIKDKAIQKLKAKIEKLQAKEKLARLKRKE
jgi:hypothetical protein